MPKIKDEPLETEEPDDWSVLTVKEELEEEEVKIEPESPKQRKLLTCDHCSYTTSWRSNLTKHVTSRHTSLDQIKWLYCPQCPYRGKTRDYLKCHLLHVHDSSTRYPCAQCPFKAKTKRLLDRHVILNHTPSDQIQWLQCGQCPYKTKFKYNLREHVLSKHADDSTIKWFECEHCDFKAKRRRNLKFHHINKHTDHAQIEWAECEFCRCKFKTKGALRAHVAALHRPETKEVPVFIDNKLCFKRIVVGEGLKQDTFTCVQCDYKSWDKRAFKKHILKMHMVTELKKENNRIVKKTYKTKDIVVIVDDKQCVKKIIDRECAPTDFL